MDDIPWGIVRACAATGFLVKAILSGLFEKSFEPVTLPIVPGRDVIRLGRGEGFITTLFQRIEELRLEWRTRAHGLRAFRVVTSQYRPEH